MNEFIPKFCFFLLHVQNKLIKFKAEQTASTSFKDIYSFSIDRSMRFLALL